MIRQRKKQYQYHHHYSIQQKHRYLQQSKPIQFSNHDEKENSLFEQLPNNEPGVGVPSSDLTKQQLSQTKDNNKNQNEKSSINKENIQVKHPFKTKLQTQSHTQSLCKHQSSVSKEKTKSNSNAILSVINHDNNNGNGASINFLQRNITKEQKTSTPNLIQTNNIYLQTTNNLMICLKRNNNTKKNPKNSNRYRSSNHRRALSSSSGASLRTPKNQQTFRCYPQNHNNLSSSLSSLYFPITNSNTNTLSNNNPTHKRPNSSYSSHSYRNNPNNNNKSQNNIFINSNPTTATTATTTYHYLNSTSQFNHHHYQNHQSSSSSSSSLLKQQKISTSQALVLFSKVIKTNTDRNDQKSEKKVIGKHHHLKGSKDSKDDGNGVWAKKMNLKHKPNKKHTEQSLAVEKGKRNQKEIIKSDREGNINKNTNDATDRQLPLKEKELNATNRGKKQDNKEHEYSFVRKHPKIHPQNFQIKGWDVIQSQYNPNPTNLIIEDID